MSGSVSLSALISPKEKTASRSYCLAPEVDRPVLGGILARSAIRLPTLLRRSNVADGF